MSNNLSSTSLFSPFSITYLPQYGPSSLEIYFLPLGAQNSLQIGISLLFSSDSPNCASLKTKSHAFFISPSQMTFMNFGNYLYNSFSSYSHIVLMIALSLLLWTDISCPFNNIISPCQGHTIGMHNLVINFIWEQFSSPEQLDTLLEQRKEVKFLFVI